VGASFLAIFLFLTSKKQNGKSRLRCLQLFDGNEVMVGQKIAFPQAYLGHSA